MRTNRELALAVKRALATGTIALCGAGAMVAYAQPATTAQATVPQATAAKATTQRATTAKKPILLAQATTAESSTAAAPATVAAPQLQTVIVTGSLIARPAAETAEAITILKADVLKNQGITNIEQALNTVTSNTPSVNISSAIGSFSGGGTYANLRNLGQSRTLVLLDGQRLAPNAFSGNAVDLGGIPFSAIDGVEVLREGASALYGSDAIAGVINFKTKRNYQGLQLQGNFDHPQEHGGGSIEGDIAFGHGDLVSDGYNFMITGSFQHQQEIQATWRKFSAQGYDPARGVTNTNDPGTWPGTFVDSVGNFWQPNYPTCPGNPFLEIDPNNLGNTCAYRYSAATDDIPDSKETSGLASFTKALPANNTLQLQYFYTRSELTAWSGPMFYALPISDTNPYIPAPSALTCEAGCTVDGSATGAPTATPIMAGGYTAIWSDPLNNRYTGNINTEQRALLTFAGSNAGWDYAVSGNYSQNKNNNNNVSNFPDETVLAPTGAKKPTFGAPGVPGVLSDLINPFGPQSAAGQALINQSYIAGTYLLGEDKRWSIDGHASHELGDAFNAGTPATVALGVSVGGEHFQSDTSLYNDITSAATGLSDSAISKSRQFQAAFLEVDVPMAKNVDLDVSDREDRYSDFGRTNNAKLSVRYQPASFLTFRGTASTGFRAPTLNELYASNAIAASTSGTMGQGNPDCPPASGAHAIAPFTDATCTTQGLGITGGNSNLTPETSQNFDFGIIISPIRNLGITLDYYRILLKNTIGSIPASAMYANPGEFTKYYVLATGSNPATGVPYPSLTPSVDSATSCIPFSKPSCGYLVLTNQNTGRSTTDGIDLSILYSQHTPIGTFHEDLEGTAVTKFEAQQYNGGPERNLVGWFNHLPPSYRWEHDLRLDWTSPEGMWGGGLSNRFYSTYIDQFKDGNGKPRIVGSYSLVDGYVSVKPIHSLTVLFGIKNILDRSPPFTNASQNNFTAGYNSLVVDPLMRNFYVNVKYDIY
ncbi:MAG TPA: TonB-dependent receptor [Steroidobacteraceae bacterium]|jgi:iron complex outermembrane receptor protein